MGVPFQKKRRSLEAASIQYNTIVDGEGFRSKSNAISVSFPFNLNLKLRTHARLLKLR